MISNIYKLWGIREQSVFDQATIREFYKANFQHSQRHVRKIPHSACGSSANAL